MKRLIHKFSIRSSFKREMFFGLLLASLIPAIVVSVLLIYVSKTKIINNYEKECSQQLEIVCDALNSYFKDISIITDDIISEEKIVLSIDKKDNWEKNKTYNRLYQLTEKLRSKASFNIYNLKGDCIFSTDSYDNKKSLPVYWGILKVSGTHPEEFIVRKSILAENDNIVLQTVKAITTEEDCVGYVVTDIKNEDLDTVMYKSFNPSKEITIVDSFFEQIYSTGTGIEKNAASFVRDRILNDDYLLNKNQKIDFALKNISGTGLSVVLKKDPVITEDITRIMIGVSFSVGTLSFILCLIISTVFSAYMANPVNELSKAIEKMESGNLNISVKSKRKDELGRLSVQFDEMASKLKNYMELQVRQQKELNDSNIAMMQAQLNPHFLYNTLDTIKWVAKLNKVPQISKMAADLALILRMSISEQPFITIKQELDLVEKYVEIQQIRFGGNFTCDFELPMELEDAIVPKLIIQPIVENALIHGLKEQEKGHIFVNIYESKGNLKIEVSDDGCGIDEKICEKINSRNREDFKGHIGFYNVDTIIKLHYGEEYGIKVENLPTGGTKVHLTLPVQLKI